MSKGIKRSKPLSDADGYRYWISFRSKGKFVKLDFRRLKTTTVHITVKGEGLTHKFEPIPSDKFTDQYVTPKIKKIGKDKKVHYVKISFKRPKEEVLHAMKGNYKKKFTDWIYSQKKDLLGMEQVPKDFLCIVYPHFYTNEQIESLRQAYNRKKVPYELFRDDMPVVDKSKKGRRRIVSYGWLNHVVELELRYVNTGKAILVEYFMDIKNVRDHPIAVLSAIGHHWWTDRIIDLSQYYTKIECEIEFKFRKMMFGQQVEPIVQGFSAFEELFNVRKKWIAKFSYLGDFMMSRLKYGTDGGKTKKVGWRNLGLDAFKALISAKPFVNRDTAMYYEVDGYQLFLKLKLTKAKDRSFYKTIMSKLNTAIVKYEKNLKKEKAVWEERKRLKAERLKRAEEYHARVEARAELESKKVSRGEELLEKARVKRGWMTEEDYEEYMRQHPVVKKKKKRKRY